VFNYILENKRTYNMDGLKMDPLVSDSVPETDHILVQFLFHRVQYRDPQVHFITLKIGHFHSQGEK
jgi:hypothetical protein